MALLRSGLLRGGRKIMNQITLCSFLQFIAINMHFWENKKTNFQILFSIIFATNEETGTVYMFTNMYSELKVCSALIVFFQMSQPQALRNGLTILTGKSCLIQFSARTYWNRSSAASDLFHMFTQSIKFYYIPLPHIKEYRCLEKVILK